MVGEKNMQHLKDIGIHPLHHKACLYIGKYEEFDVLVCQQINNFMF
jgi:hypothetical protein